MGCYDIVLVPCPKCGTKYPCQSKGSECLMRTFELLNCPADIMSDVNRHAPYTCETCSTQFFVQFELTVGKLRVVENKEKI